MINNKADYGYFQRIYTYVIEFRFSSTYTAININLSLNIFYPVLRLGIFKSIFVRKEIAPRNISPKDI